MPRVRSRLFTAVCIVVLLFAQFGALTHAAWHAADGGHAHAYAVHDPAGTTSDAAHNDADSDVPYPASQADLCAFDAAFGHVLGGVHTCAPLTFALAPGAVALLDIPASRLRAEALSPKSRGPPLLL